MRVRAAAFLLGLTCFASHVCGEPNDLGDVPDGSGGVVRASNSFGLSLYKALVNGTDGNIFFSPWSLSRVLSMVLLGARNKTASQLTRALFLEGFSDSTAVLSAQREQALRLVHSDDLASTSVALTRAGDPVSAEYLDVLNRYLDDGGVMQVDFSRADELLSRVNGEVSRLTDGRIQNALRRAPDPLSKLLLLNAVHFKGVWAKAFDPNDTYDGFFRGATKNSPVRMMATKGKYKLAYDGGAYLLELPYTGDSSLLLALPRNRAQKDLSALEARLEDFVLASTVEHRTLELELPRLSLHSSLDLKDPLRQLGVDDLFSEQDANLRGMQPEGGLYVEDVHHEASLELDEKGTTASASTVAVIVSRIGTPRFAVDRPFVFALKHRPSGLLLFMGRVLDL